MEIVANHLSASWDLSDIRTHEGKHDFDLSLPDGSTMALEVTTGTDQDVRGLYHALDRHGVTLGPAAGSRSWLLHGGGNTSVREMRKRVRELARLLGALESVGIDYFGSPDNRRQVQSFLGRFSSIKHAYSWQRSKGPAIVQLVGPPMGAYISPHRVVEFISEFLDSPKTADIKLKLDRSRADRREVFIWLEVFRFGEFESLCDGELPTDAPRLPREVTGVWVAARCRNDWTEVWRYKLEWAKIPVDPSIV